MENSSFDVFDQTELRYEEMYGVWGISFQQKIMSEQTYVVASMLLSKMQEFAELKSQEVRGDELQ